jgi:hypothetical protein
VHKSCEAVLTLDARASSTTSGSEQTHRKLLSVNGFATSAVRPAGRTATQMVVLGKLAGAQRSSAQLQAYCGAAVLSSAVAAQVLSLVTAHDQTAISSAAQPKGTAEPLTSCT